MITTYYFQKSYEIHLTNSKNEVWPKPFNYFQKLDKYCLSIFQAKWDDIHLFILETFKNQKNNWLRKKKNRETYRNLSTKLVHLFSKLLKTSEFRFT